MPELPKRIAVLGLGYVGLPLAVSLARHFPVLGFDVDRGRVAQLKAGQDRTGEVDPEVLSKSALEVSAEEIDLAGSDFFIVTVPTPIDNHKRPELTPLRKARLCL